jgi:hypothetical protein
MIGGGDGGTAARGGCYFVNSPDISMETKGSVAVGGLMLMTFGSFSAMSPTMAAMLDLGLAPIAISDGMPMQLGLFRNRYPLDPIDIAKIVPTSQLSRISGNFNYVINRDGRLVVGRSAHTSLTVGAEMRAAGEVQLFNGRIKWIDNASGHYRPTGTHLGPLVENAFNSVGLDATGKFVLRTFE